MIAAGLSGRHDRKSITIGGMGSRATENVDGERANERFGHAKNHSTSQGVR